MKLKRNQLNSYGADIQTYVCLINYMNIKTVFLPSDMCHRIKEALTACISSLIKGHFRPTGYRPVQICENIQN